MIADLKPYAEYKESGLPWIRQVPGHWELRRMRASITDCVNGVWGAEPNGEDDLICVRVADFDRVGLRVSLRKKTVRAIPMSARSRRLLRRGDLLLEKSGGGDLQPVGTVVAYDHDEPAVCSNFVARMPMAAGYDPFFVNYLHFTLYANRVNIRSIKQTTGIQNLDGKAYLSELVAFPPPDEQAAIVRFLDWANGRLERAIRAKRKVIALLSEQKQAIIHRAVTRGLDPSVPLKPSGIPWLGDIPQHWVVRRLKHLAWFQSGDGITSLQIEATGPYPVYGGNGLRGYTTRHTHDGHYALIGRQGALCGNINYAHGQFFASEHAVVATLHAGMSVVWFGELLRGMNLNQYSQSAAQPGLAVERIKNLYAPVPPVREQHTIVGSFERSTAPLITAIARLEREIELLCEYRTRLVADVVTGKLDVREAAARLPDEAALDPAEDDTGPSIDPESADGEPAA